MNGRAGLVLAATVLGPSGVAIAQLNPLYMVSYDTNDVVVIQNGVLIDQWTNSGAFQESGLAIQSTIKMVGRNPGQNGAEYALDGTPLGGGPYFNPAYVDCYDGATNGQTNWSIAHNDFTTNFAVVSGDADWAGLAVDFVPTERSSGITYDAGTNTLWIANNFGGLLGLQEYDLAGNLLTDIDIPFLNGAGYGLAWDPADDTLWMSGAFSSGFDCAQFDKNGNLLQSVDIPGIDRNWISAEILASSCPWDLDGSGAVGTADLLDLLSAWGPNPGHPADFNGDGSVGTADLLKLLSNWGGCP
jgi:hypothetical protein